MKTKFILLLLLAASIFPIEALSNEVKKVAILDIVDREEKISYGIKLMLRSNLENAITNTPGYEGLDRVDVTSIINEQNFQRTGMVDDSQIKQLGEMTGADYILVAEGAMINSNEIFLTAKIINIESAHLERTANIQTTLSSSDLGKNCRSLAGNLFNVKLTDNGNLIIDHKNIQEIIKSYIAANQYTEAISTIDKYIAENNKDIKATDYYRFGTNCLTIIQKDSQNTKNYLYKAETYFKKVIEKSPNLFLGYLGLARTAGIKDPETKYGYAKPYYEKTIELLDKMDTNQTTIQIRAYIESYKYLGYYNYLKAYAEPAKANEYKEQTRYYWNKMLEYDPQNTEITEALKNLYYK